MSASVLFFDFAFEEYLPVIEKATQLGIRPIMNQPAMQEVLANRGTVARGFLEFAQQADVAAAKDDARALGSRFAATIREEGAVSAFDTEAGNLLVDGGSELVGRILELTENQLLLARVMRRLLVQEDVKTVVMRSCLSAGQRIVQGTAQQAGVPVIELSHGNPAWGSDLEPPAIPWHFAVFGKRERDALVAMGSNPDRVPVTGAAHWDPLYEASARLSKEAARALLGIPEDAPVVLFAGSFTSGGTLFFADTALRAMRANTLLARGLSQMTNAPLLAVRPHPGESRQKPGRRPTMAELSDYRDWFLRQGVNLLHVDYSEGSIVREKAALIRACDVVVTPDASSTLITEVMILERPCVMIDAGESPFVSFYSERDGVVSVRTAAELTYQLEQLLEKPRYRTELLNAAQSALPELNHQHDGKSADRVAELVERLTREDSDPEVGPGL